MRGKAVAFVPRPLPDERRAITHKFSIGGYEGHLTVGLYPDGTPGEIHIVLAKGKGGVVGGLMEATASVVSLTLQHGAPLDVIVEKYRGVRFEPSGATSNPAIPRTTSIADYVARWLAIKFLSSHASTAN